MGDIVLIITSFLNVPFLRPNLESFYFSSDEVQNRYRG